MTSGRINQVAIFKNSFSVSILKSANQKEYLQEVISKGDFTHTNVSRHGEVGSIR